MSSGRGPGALWERRAACKGLGQCSTLLCCGSETLGCRVWTKILTSEPGPSERISEGTKGHLGPRLLGLLCSRRVSSPCLLSQPSVHPLRTLSHSCGARAGLHFSQGYFSAPSELQFTPHLGSEKDPSVGPCPASAVRIYP